MNTQDTWSLGGREFTSRFILGSGKYSLELIEAAVRDAGAQMITLAVRRANTTEKENILDYIPQGVTVRQLNLIGVGSRTVVILLVASNGIIKNKVCRVDFNVTQELLTFFNSFAAGRLVGMSINDLAEGYLSAASVALGEYAQVFNSILSAIFDLCREVSGGQYYQSGASNLLAYDELRQGARDVFQLLQNRAAVWEMIFSQQKEPLQIRVGRENPSQELADFSLMVCRYNIDKDNTGAIGILGPVRMDYARLVPHLEYFAQTLGKLLADTMDGH